MYTAGSSGSSALYVNNTTGRVFKLSSSKKFKKDINSLEAELDLKDYLKLEPKAFTYLQDSLSDRSYGFIAEEALSSNPQFVTRDSNNKIQGFKYNDMIAANFMAIKHVYSETDLLKQKVANLEKELDFLRKKLDQGDSK